MKPQEERKSVVMTDTDWAEQFKPIKNHLDPNASFSGFDPESEDGCMFETSGREFAYIQSILDGKVPGLTAANVWTWMDGYTPSSDEPAGARLREKGYSFDEDTCSWVKDEEMVSFDFIGDGFHYVNRIGYLVTRVPADPNTDYSIYSGEDVVAAFQPEEVAA